MNELKNILDQAVSIEDGVVNPAADVARGRGALRKRRMTWIGTGMSGVAVIAAVSGVLVSGNGKDQPVPAVAGSATTAPAEPTGPATPASGEDAPEELQGIELVAYTGKQAPGYKVKFVPKGWEIQGGNNFTLTIAPKGFKNQNVNEWVGKIAVQLASGDAEELTPITKENLKAWGMEGENLLTTVSPVTVNGEKGALSRPETPDRTTSVIVSFPDAKGHDVIVQGPSSLEWSDAQWIEFAEGVKVLGNAAAGKG